MRASTDTATPFQTEGTFEPLMTHTSKLASPAVRQVDPEVVRQLEDAVKAGDLTALQQTLAEYPALLNASLSDGATVLHRAASLGRLDILAFLVRQEGIELNPVDRQGFTPLLRAIEQNQSLAAQQLLDLAGVDVEAKWTSGATAFYVAIERGQTDVAGLLLLRGVALNPIQYDGRSAFHAACGAGEAKAAAWLIEQQAMRDPAGGGLRAMLNRPDRMGVTPLHLAAKSGHLAVVALLLEQPGLNPNLTDREDRTALHEALAAKQSAVVLALLAHRAIEVDPRLPDGATPLALAVQGDDLAAAQALRDRGADVQARLNDGSTLLHVASKSSSGDTVQWLLAQGLNTASALNERDDAQHTPLLVAAVANNLAAAQALLAQREIDPNAGDHLGWTPLHEAALKGRTELIDALLAHLEGDVPIDPDMGEENGATALHVAVDNDQALAVRHLLQSDTVDPNTVDGRAWPALHKAIRRAQLDMVRALLNAPKIDATEPGPCGLNILHMLGQVADDADAVMLEREIRTGIRTPGVYEALVHRPDDWGQLPVSMAAQRGKGQALIEALRPGTVAPGNPITATTYQRGWLISGPEMDAWESRQLAGLGELGGITMQTHGNGRESLTWEGVKALDVRRGDFVICNFHAYWDEDLQMVMVELGDGAFVPLVVLARLLWEKGVSKALFLGCEVSLSAEPMLACFSQDPTMPKPPDNDSGFHGLEFTVVGREKKTLISLNQDAAQFFVEDCIHQLKHHTPGAALRTRSVQPSITLGWSASQGKLVLTRREELSADRLDPGLSEDQVHGVWKSLMLMHALDNEEGPFNALVNAHPSLVHARFDGGTSVLQVACLQGNASMVSTLLLRGADIEHRDNNGASALLTACVAGHKSVVELLLRNGADVHLPAPSAMDGYTPLHAASECGHAEIVALLLEKGASATAMTADGKTALQLAQAAEQEQVVALLKPPRKKEGNRW